MIIFFDEMSENTKEAVVQFYFFSRGRDTGSFSYRLYQMIEKADKDNLSKLEKGFPEHVHVWEHYNKLSETEMSNFLSNIFNHCIKQLSDTI